jgi:hypothetical protein
MLRVSFGYTATNLTTPPPRFVQGATAVVLVRLHHRRIVKTQAFAPVVRRPVQTGDLRAAPSHRPMAGP